MTHIKTKLFKIFLALLMYGLSQQLFAKSVLCYRATNIVTQQKYWVCVYSEFDCTFPHMTANSFCVNYSRVANTPPVINAFDDGSATLNDNGRIIPIISDQFLEAVTANKPLSEFATTHSSTKVSIERLNAIAKELNATIVKSGKRVEANYCPACDEEKNQASNQPQTGWKPQSTSLLFAGIGFTSPASALKDNTYLGNSTALHLGAHIPFISKPKFGFGINTGFNLGWSGKPNINTINPYQVSGQSFEPAIITDSSQSPGNSSFRFEAGPSALFNLGDGFSINPSLNAAYVNLTNKSFTATQVSEVNGTTYSWNLLQQAEAKASGMGFAPKLRLIYLFGNIGIWAEGSYITGPKLTTTSTVFHPEGNATDSGFTI